MPLSREFYERLQKSCSSPRERFVVFLLRDLEGHGFDPSQLNTSGIDRVTGRLVLPSRGGQGDSVPLGQDTLKAFEDYAATRGDRDTALFVNDQGRRMTRDEFADTADGIGQRTELEFDKESLRFRQGRTETPRLVSKTASRDLFYLYGIVSHPVRRQIVELLGDEGPLGFSQINQRLKVKVGTLYYHFDMLAGLIVQDSQKRYQLTEAGKDAYRRLRSADYVQSSERLVEQSPAVQTSVEKGLRLLIPSRILTSIQSRQPISMIAATAIVILGSFSVWQAQLIPVLLFFDPSNLDPLLLATGFILNWLAMFAISDVLATYLFGRRGEHLTLLLGTAYALIPLVVFVGWWDLATSFSIQGFGLTTFGLSRVVLIVLQAWSLALLARLVGGLKGLRLDKAAIISLALAYLSIMVAYLGGF